MNSQGLRIGNREDERRLKVTDRFFKAWQEGDQEAAQRLFNVAVGIARREAKAPNPDKILSTYKLGLFQYASEGVEMFMAELDKFLERRERARVDLSGG